MKLTKYKSKRDLKKSPEPKAKIKKTAKGALRFVVQEHDASHLHYDLRLEVDGVLKSWAVPKKPTMDPSVKRLAIMVEDHPYDYQYFEGTIPFGYGAGTVVIWDKGTYQVEDKSPEDSEKMMKAGLKKGAVHFTLQGKRLKGEFALVRLKRGQKENEWLLIKKQQKESDVMAKYGKKAGEKVERAMHEMKRGKLKSGKSGKKVKSRKQAIAIGLSEARKKGAKVPKKRTTAKRRTTSKKRTASK